MLLRSGLAILWVALVIVLPACGQDSGSKAATQVAVKVNDDEISVHQVNAQLARVSATGLSAEQRLEVKQRIVDELVDQQLLIEKSVEAKLDRDPQVLAALESSRRQILAQAYVQKKIAPSSRPTDEEIKRYYDSNPALFSERKAYRLQEITTTLPKERVQDLESELKGSKSLNDVATWLEKAGYRFSARAAVRGAEQLPLVALPQVAAMKNGEIAAFVNDNQVTVLQVVESQPQPLNEKEAAPYIEQFLSNAKRDELLRAELKQLRESAKIQYVGDLAGASTKVPGVGAAGQPAGSAGSAVAGSGSTAPDKPSENAAVEKGVRGLR